MTPLEFQSRPDSIPADLSHLHAPDHQILYTTTYMYQPDGNSDSEYDSDKRPNSEDEAKHTNNNSDEDMNEYEYTDASQTDDDSNATVDKSEDPVSGEKDAQKDGEEVERSVCKVCKNLSHSDMGIYSSTYIHVKELDRSGRDGCPICTTIFRICEHFAPNLSYTATGWCTQSWDQNSERYAIDLSPYNGELTIGLSVGPGNAFPLHKWYLLGLSFVESQNPYNLPLISTSNRRDIGLWKFAHDNTLPANVVRY